MKLKTRVVPSGTRLSLLAASLSLAAADAPALPPPVCPGDANGDLIVNFSDVLESLANFGGSGPSGDADGNCTVNFADILAELAAFGATCPWPRLTEPATTRVFAGAVVGLGDGLEVYDYPGAYSTGASPENNGAPGGGCFFNPPVSAAELEFQTDGPIICQALFQRLAPKPPGYYGPFADSLPFSLFADSLPFRVDINPQNQDLMIHSEAPPMVPDSCYIPEVWRVDPVPWNRDSGLNKVDDRIDIGPSTETPGADSPPFIVIGEPVVGTTSLTSPIACMGFRRTIEPGLSSSQAPVGPGVLGGSGEVILHAMDATIPGRGFDFTWERMYRSRTGADTPMGVNWDHNHNVFVEACGSDLNLHDGSGRQDRYSLVAPNTWHAPEFFRVITRNPGGDFTVTLRHGTRLNLRALDGSPAQGKIDSIVDRNGNTMRYQYDGLGRLVAIRDTLDDILVPRVVMLSYNAQGRIETVTDWTGREVRYEYYGPADPDGALGDLKLVRSPIIVADADYNVLPGHEYPAGKTTVYTYSRGFADDRLNHNLLTITDPKGQLYCSMAYAPTLSPSSLDFDRAARMTLGAQGPLGDNIDLVYQTVAPSAANNFARLRVIVNDRVGNVRERFFDFGNRLVMAQDYTGRAPDADAPTTDVLNRPVGQVRASDPPLYETRYEYNADALLTRVVLPNGSEVLWQRDSGNVNRLAQVNLLSRTRLPGPMGGAQPSIQVTLGNYSAHHFPGFVTDPRGNTTQYSYDGAGNRIQAIHRIPTIVESWGQNGFGQIVSHTWPDNGSGYNRVDTFDYYTVADGYQHGYLRRSTVDIGTLALATLFEFDRVGNPRRTIDPRGFDRLYDINQLNQLIRARSPVMPLPMGAPRYATQYFYDANNNLAQCVQDDITDAGTPSAFGTLVREFQFDILNRLIEDARQRDLVNFVRERYVYDANGNVIEYRNGQATSGADPFNVERYVLDERDLIFRRIRGAGSPDQSSDRFDWNLNGARIAAAYRAEVVPQLWLLTYDGYDRRIKIVDPMGNEGTYDYDANGNLEHHRQDGELVDVAGGAGNIRFSETAHIYDAMDRRFRTDVQFFDPATQLPIGAGVASLIVAYTDMSRPRTVTDDNARTTTYDYDTAGRRSVLTDPRGNTYTRAYDANSNVIGETTVEKSDLGNPDQVFVTSQDYDPVNRLVRFTDNIGNSHAYAYDSRSNATTQVDARGNTSRYEYDGLDRVVREERMMTSTGDGGGVVIGSIVTTQSWDDSSRLTARTDGNGNISQHFYDALDRLVSTQHADLKTRTVSYDAADNPVSRTDANGTVVTGTYDLLNRLESCTVAPGPGVLGTLAESFEYDGLSRLVRASDDDTDATFAYDSMSNRISESMQVLPAGPVRLTTSAYDGVGNRTSLVYPGGRIVTYNYDLLDRISSIVDGVAGHIASQSYSGPACVEERDCSNDTRVHVAEDAGKRTVGTVHSRISTGIPFDHRLYGRDAMHNKQVENNPLAPMPPDDLFYRYDSADRLVQTQKIPFGPPPPATVYTLDSAGNRQNVSGTVDPGVYVMSPVMPNPADRQMNQYTQTPIDARIYDANGNMIQNTVPVRTYAYDFQDRLVHHQNGAVVTQYLYDALGRRVQKQVGAARTRFYYDGWREIEEQDSADVTAGTLVHGNAIDEIVQMERAAQQYFFHTDDLGTTRKVSDSLGVIVEAYAYADYGRPSYFDGAGAPIPNSAIGNDHLFTGRRYDPETGLYYFRHRYFDPRAGRFITHDPIGDWGDEANRGNGSAYCGNNPTSRVDPLGLSPAGAGYMPIAGQWAPVLSTAALSTQYQLSNWSHATYQLSNWSLGRYQLSRWSPAQYVLSQWTPWQCVPSVWSFPQYVLSRWSLPNYVLSNWGPTPYVLSPAGPTPYVLSPSSAWVLTNPSIGAPGPGRDGGRGGGGGSAFGP